MVTYSDIHCKLMRFCNQIHKHYKLINAIRLSLSSVCFWSRHIFCFGIILTVTLHMILGKHWLDSNINYHH